MPHRGDDRLEVIRVHPLVELHLLVGEVVRVSEEHLSRGSPSATRATARRTVRAPRYLLVLAQGGNVLLGPALIYAGEQRSQIVPGSRLTSPGHL